MAIISTMCRAGNFLAVCLINAYRALVGECNRPKSNFFDLAVHISFFLYALNYIIYFSMGQALLIPDELSSNKVYFENFAGHLILFAGGLAAVKCIVSGYPFRLCLEILIAAAILIGVFAIDPTGTAGCTLIVVYSLTRIIQMAGTNKVSG